MSQSMRNLHDMKKEKTKEKEKRMANKKRRYHVINKNIHFDHHNFGVRSFESI